MSQCGIYLGMRCFFARLALGRGSRRLRLSTRHLFVMPAESRLILGKVMKITRLGSVPSQPALKEYFTGSARVDSRFKAEEPARTVGAIVTFEPGARTNWHTHPLGQTLIVTQG